MKLGKLAAVIVSLLTAVSLMTVMVGSAEEENGTLPTIPAVTASPFEPLETTTTTIAPEFLALSYTDLLAMSKEEIGAVSNAIKMEYAIILYFESEKTGVKITFHEDAPAYADNASRLAALGIPGEIVDRCGLAVSGEDDFYVFLNPSGYGENTQGEAVCKLLLYLKYHSLAAKAGGVSEGEMMTETVTTTEETTATEVSETETTAIMTSETETSAPETGSDLTTVAVLQTTTTTAATASSITASPKTGDRAAFPALLAVLSGCTACAFKMYRKK